MDTSNDTDSEYSVENFEQNIDNVVIDNYIDDSSETIDNSAIIRQNVLSMLHVRKYNIIDDNYFDLNHEEFIARNGNDDKICVFFPNTPKVGVTTIRQYIKEMTDNDVQQAIIIVKDSITAFAKQVFLEAKPLIIEHFHKNELLIDKLKHVLVPMHEIISDEEKKELMSIYKLKDAQLPKIAASDPISKYFGARRGQVFKITRTSETGGKYIYYRIVA